MHEHAREKIALPQSIAILFVGGVISANPSSVIRLLSVLRNDYIRWEYLVIFSTLLILVLGCAFILTEVKYNLSLNPIPAAPFINFPSNQSVVPTIN